jgi:ankyrin repeat protein
MEKTDRAVLEVTDRDGRTALHYAAGIANDDDRKMFDWLVEHGADETKSDKVIDYYYKSHSHSLF